MAQTYQNTDGTPGGCYPAADVRGTTLTYTAGSAPNTLASVTVFFNIHTDGGGAQRDGFVKIKCVPGGPTSDFRYTTVGDTGHSSQYEIDTVADCSRSGGGPPQPPGPPPPSSPTFDCLNGTCVSAFPPGSGVPKDVCERICIKPDTKYLCKGDVCVPSSDPTRGVDRETCEAVCVPVRVK
jgi:hypothetical protein